MTTRRFIDGYGRVVDIKDAYSEDACAELEEAAHAEFLDRFTRDLREANRVRWEAFRTGDERLHRVASEKIWILTREARR